jgi:hypothetical protein
LMLNKVCSTLNLKVESYLITVVHKLNPEWLSKRNF